MLLMRGRGESWGVARLADHPKDTWEVPGMFCTVYASALREHRPQSLSRQ